MTLIQMPELIVNMRPLLCPRDWKCDNRANQSQAYQFSINLIKQIIKYVQIPFNNKQTMIQQVMEFAMDYFFKGVFLITHL